MADKKKPRRPARRDPERLRTRIDALTIIETLEQHVIGKKKMSPTQVRAALALLQKTLPDMTGVARQKDVAAHEDALKDLE